MQYNDMKMDSQGNVYIAYITSEETFSLAKKGENGFSVLASGAVSERILNTGPLTQTEEEKDKLYLPEPVNIMFDSHDVPYVMGYLDECMVVYKYDENAKALVQVSKHELSYNEEEEVYSYKNLHRNLIVDDHFNAYFTVSYAPLIKTEIDISADYSQYVLEVIKYDVENNKFTSNFFKNVKINSPALFYSSEDSILYAYGNRIDTVGTYKSIIELNTFTFQDNGYITHKNTSQLVFSDIRGTQCIAGAILSDNNNIYVTYLLAENFFRSETYYMLKVSNNAIVDSKTIDNAAINLKERPIAYPRKLYFYCDNGCIYFFEIYNDRRDDFSICRFDFISGEFSKMSGFLLSEKYTPYVFDIISDENGGLHIAYLLESGKGIGYFHMN